MARNKIRRQKSHVQRTLYAFRYRVGEYALRAFIGCVRHVPYGVLSSFTRVMARVTYVLLWEYRRRMEENVALVMGEEISNAKERKALVWRAWLNFARGVADTTAVMKFSKEQIMSFVGLEGEDHVKRALEKGKGVIALSAHLGSFTMIGARLAAAGYPFSVVVKQPTDERFAQLVDDYRAEIGIHTISAKPRREAVRGILKALRQNHIVLVIADEFKSGDVMVDFLGLKVPAPRGPATLALRTGAVTLPMFVTRQPDDSLRLSVGAPIAPIECADLDESVLATTALYTRQIEGAARKYPDQWNWLGLPRHNGKPPRAQMGRRRKASRANASGVSTRSDRIGRGTSSF